MGVIDSLSEGLALVRRRPLVMAIPVAMDAVIWLAPKLSVQPVFEDLARGLQSPLVSGGQTAEQMQAFRELVLSLGESTNLLGLLSGSIVGVPSVLAGGMPEGTANVGGSVLVSSPVVALLAALLFGVVGLLLTALYLTVVATVVRGDKARPAGVIRSAGRVWGKLLLMVVALALLIIAVSIPIGGSVVLLSIVSPTAGAFLASMVSLFGLWIGIWVLFYLFFVVDAMVLQDVGLQRAVVNSIVVVRSSFWSAVGFIILLNLIAAGLSVVWQRLAESAVAGVVAAIAGNAFVGTGLAAASLVFYRDRYDAWRKRVLEKGGK